MRTTRKLLPWLLLAAALPIMAEALSSYVLYRDVAWRASILRPRGSATLELLKRLSYKLEGRRQVAISISPGPLFYADPILGYAMHVGHFMISEHIDNLDHRFQVTIDTDGNRATAYQLRRGSRRIFITGDSAFFGWGLNDEDTVPWLLQSRLPDYGVVNWSLTGVGQVTALLQLQQPRAVAPDDVVVVTYHPMMLQWNAADPAIFSYFPHGLEAQTADEGFVAAVDFPYGTLDEAGNLVIKRVKMDCLIRASNHDCDLGKVTLSTEIRVTERAFDAIESLHPGRVLVAVIGGPDSDPVVAYLRSKGVMIADVRPTANDPEKFDEMAIDTHGGPFLSNFYYTKLYAALRDNRLIP